jgi:thiol-disulfide isomerase/thioredoxin
MLRVLAAALLLAGCSRMPPLAEPGKPAPAFRLAGLAGQAVSLSDYRGRLLLVNFWATWCPDCREEFPLLERLYRRHRRAGLDIVAASIDEGGRKAVLPFVAAAAPSFTVCLADRKTQAAYSVRALPASFLIGPDGRLLKAYVGALDGAALENDILRYLPRRNS